MKNIETGAVHFFFNFDKIIRNKKLAIFQHSLKDLDLLVISINKNWCLILYKTKTSKIQTGPISCSTTRYKNKSCVCSIMPSSLVNKCINIIHRDRWTKEF